MGRWLPGSGERIGSGPSFEIYRNSPMDTPPDQLRTELHVPLA
ncbi:MAG: Transcriptional regulator, AraC family [Labilithrix sp.]|nr:Transcriptional regulator, AraC family [Labilithrix sp.]